MDLTFVDHRRDTVAPWTSQPGLCPLTADLDFCIGGLGSPRQFSIFLACQMDGFSHVLIWHQAGALMSLPLN